jgi:hypothetical protein
MPLYLTIDPVDPLEATANLVAAVAFPKDLPEGEAFADAHVSLMAYMYRTAAAADPNWAWKRQSIKPAYLLEDLTSIERRLPRITLELQRALQVARIARPFLGKVVLPEPPPLPQDLPRLSLNAVINFALGEDSQVDRHNFEQRAFRQRLPVLHLAVALEHALVEAHAATGAPASLETLLLAPDILPWLVEHARRLEEPVLAIEAFRVDEATQVRMRLAP